MTPPIYSDGRYTVTAGSVSTPNRFYPVANTTASVRRDPLWAGLAVSAVALLAVLTYGDLLFPGELLVLLALAAGAMGVGFEIRVLRIDAIGHRPATIVGRRSRIAALYRAIRTAHDDTFRNSVSRGSGKFFHEETRG